MTPLGSTTWRSAISVVLALGLTLGSAAVAHGATEPPTVGDSVVRTTTDEPTADASTEPTEQSSSTATEEPTEQATEEPTADAPAPDPEEPSAPEAESASPTTSPETTAEPDADEPAQAPAQAEAQAQAVEPTEYAYWALPYTRYLYEIGADGAPERAFSLAGSDAYLAAHPDRVGDAFAVGAATIVSSVLDRNDYYGRIDWAVLGGTGVTTTLLTSGQVALARDRIGSAWSVRGVAHIPGTRYRHFSTASNPDEVIAFLPTGTVVKMTAAQYANAGSPRVTVSALQFYTVPWRASVWRVNSQTGDSTRLSASQWQERYGGAGAAPAALTIVKVPWDSTRYAYVSMGSSSRWVQWVKDAAMTAAIRAASPEAWSSYRTVAHIPGSSYFRWSSSSSTERFVQTPDGDIHKLTSGEYRAAGSPTVKRRTGYVVRPAWSTNLWWFASTSTSARAYRLTTTAYQDLDEPRPRVWTRVPGDRFYRWQGVSTIYWSLRGHVESLSSSEYASAGRPTLTTRSRPAGGYGGSDGENATPGTNGVVPSSDLCTIPFLPTHKIRCGTLRDLLAFNDAYYAHFGTNLPIDTWRYSTFRSYRDQVAVWNEIGPPNAARPGTSPHGYGLAIDFVERYGFSSVQNRWLATHGPTYHWVRQPWHDQGGSWGEWWHFDYIG